VTSGVLTIFGPHTRVLEFMMGEWKDAETILARAAQGFVRAELLG